MSLKNLNVSNKTHKFLLNKLKDKKTFQIYNKFEKSLNLNKNFAVAVSGGADSLALAYLAKIYSIKNRLSAKFFIVDHKLRSESSHEAKSGFQKLVYNSNRTSQLSANLLSLFHKSHCHLEHYCQ